jgi:hypothetical protein
MHEKARGMFRGATERTLYKVLALLDGDMPLCPNLMIVLAKQREAAEATIDQLVRAAQHIDSCSNREN